MKIKYFVKEEVDKFQNESILNFHLFKKYIYSEKAYDISYIGSLSISQDYVFFLNLRPDDNHTHDKSFRKVKKLIFDSIFDPEFNIRNNINEDSIILNRKELGLDLDFEKHKSEILEKTK